MATILEPREQSVLGSSYVIQYQDRQCDNSTLPSKNCKTKQNRFLDNLANHRTWPVKSGFTAVLLGCNHQYFLFIEQVSLSHGFCYLQQKSTLPAPALARQQSHCVRTVGSCVYFSWLIWALGLWFFHLCTLCTYIWHESIPNQLIIEKAS